MPSAKDIILKPVPSAVARDFVRKHHYSHKPSPTANLHIGVFLNGKMEGAIQLGRPLDKSKMLGLVTGTRWEGMAELNRLVFTDALPRNSESRALSVLTKVLRKHAPQVKWIVSFADGTQCGDGTIYRASGFLLTAIKPSDALARFPNGIVSHKVTFQSSPTKPRPEAGGRSYYDVTGGRYDWEGFVKHCGGTILPGYQLRYIKFIDPAWRDRLTVPVLPFSAIQDAGAGMYLGEKR